MLEDGVLVPDLILGKLAFISKELAVKLSKFLIKIISRVLTTFFESLNDQARFLTDTRYGFKVIFPLWSLVIQVVLPTSNTTFFECYLFRFIILYLDESLIICKGVKLILDQLDLKL